MTGRMKMFKDIVLESIPSM